MMDDYVFASVRVVILCIVTPIVLFRVGVLLLGWFSDDEKSGD